MKRLHFVLFIPIFFLVSCNPCEEVDCPNPFTVEEKRWLPYSYNDTVIFSETSSDDSFVYRVSYEQSGKHEERESGAPYCMKACVYLSNVLGEILYSNGLEDRLGFSMYKNLEKLHLSSGGFPDFIFKLEDSVQMDSVLINGQYLKDVYKYKCKPEQEKVAETYMHQGMGLVKIVFRDGQDYELVEHRKAK